MMSTNVLDHKRPVKTLASGWEARQGLNGRVYYHSHCSQTIQILPPPDAWSCVHQLPYGWELAVDRQDKPYYINHVLQQVSYVDPRNDDRMIAVGFEALSSGQVPMHPREYTITRREGLGFGFIAGSEKPVIVRSVTPGGPADGMLLPGDQIVKVGDEVVVSSPRQRVISLIRDSRINVTMTVIQPAVIPNSSFLKPNKKLMKGMNKPKVRFVEKSAETNEKVQNGGRLVVEPGVLRVALEDRQPCSFEFDNDTTAGDVVGLLCEQLDVKDSSHYALVLAPPRSIVTPVKGSSPVQCSEEILIPPWEHVAKVLNSPGVKHHECHLRMAFVAKDAHKLSREDPNSFNYLYQQCVNDVNSGQIYQDDLSVDEVLRLGALHILLVTLLQEEKTSSSNADFTSRRSSKKKFYSPSKFNLKCIEKEHGLSKFLPPSIIDLVLNQSKEHRKLLQQSIKTCYNNFIVNGAGTYKTSPTSSPTQSVDGAFVDVLLPKIRMQYIKSLSHFHLYGGRYFEATIQAVVESDIILLVGHLYGISQLINSKTKMASIFSDFSHVQVIEVAPEQPGASKTNVKVDFQDMAPLVVSMDPKSALNFVYMVSGYCRVHGNNDVMLTLPIPESEKAPEYFGPHKVKPSYWSYPPDVDSSSVHCDFSKPVTFSLLSEHIPASVRAMFQQSKIEEGESNEDANLYLANSNTHSPEDEGVAMATTDASPKSSVSSMASGSPSSGIGSVSSQGNHAGKERILSTSKDVSEQDHLQRCDASGEEAWNDLMVVMREEVASGNTKDTPGNDSGSDEEVARIEDVKEKGTGASIVVKDETSFHQSPEVGSQTLQCEEESTPFKELSSGGASFENPQSRSRFSSFKPPAPLPPTGISKSKSSIRSSPSSASEPIPGDQFQVGLKDPSAVSEPHPHDYVEEEDDLKSPLPVKDLASGHKQLKAEKRKNRFSFVPTGSTVDQNSGKSSNRKSRSLFRNFFSSRKSYSMSKNQTVSYSFDEEPPKKSKWSFFGIFRSGSKRSRFSFFRRKKKSHDLNASNSLHPGAFSMFAVQEEPLNSDALKQSMSFEDISRRPREDVSSKPRPVSFMTFQQFPIDDEEGFSEVQRRVDDPETSNENKNVVEDRQLKGGFIYASNASPKVQKEDVPQTSDSLFEKELAVDGALASNDSQLTSSETSSSFLRKETSKVTVETKGSLKIKRKAPPPPHFPPPPPESPKQEGDGTRKESFDTKDGEKSKRQDEEVYDQVVDDTDDFDDMMVNAMIQNHQKVVSEIDQHLHDENAPEKHLQEQELSRSEGEQKAEGGSVFTPPFGNSDSVSDDKSTTAGETDSDARSSLSEDKSWEIIDQKEVQYVKNSSMDIKDVSTPLSYYEKESVVPEVNIQSSLSTPLDVSQYTEQDKKTGSLETTEELYQEESGGMNSDAIETSSDEDDLSDFKKMLSSDDVLGSPREDKNNFVIQELRIKPEDAQRNGDLLESSLSLSNDDDDVSVVNNDDKLSVQEAQVQSTVGLVKIDDVLQASLLSSADDKNDDVSIVHNDSNFYVEKSHFQSEIADAKDDVLQVLSSSSDDDGNDDAVIMHNDGNLSVEKARIRSEVAHKKNGDILESSSPGNDDVLQSSSGDGNSDDVSIVHNDGKLFVEKALIQSEIAQRKDDDVLQASSSDDNGDVSAAHTDVKQDRLANTLNRLLLNGIENKETPKNAPQSDALTPPGDSSPSSLSEPSNLKVKSVTLTNGHHKRAEVLSRDLLPSEVIQVEPVNAEDADTELLPSISPSENFDFSVNDKVNSDDKLANRSLSSTNVPNVNGNVAISTGDPLVRRRIKTTIEDPKQDESPKRDSYYNLIAPRLFGQQQRKPFARIKPPTINKNRKSLNLDSSENVGMNSVVRQVSYPMASDKN